MPFKSLAQEGYLHAHPEILGKEGLKEWDEATKGKHLPEHVTFHAEPIDEATAAKQFGAIGSTPAPAPAATSTPTGTMDEATAARQFGALGSTPPPSDKNPLTSFEPSKEEAAAHPYATALAQEGLTDLNEAEAKANFAKEHPIANTIGDVVSMGLPSAAAAVETAAKGLFEQGTKQVATSVLDASGKPIMKTVSTPSQIEQIGKTLLTHASKEGTFFKFPGGRLVEELVGAGVGLDTLKKFISNAVTFHAEPEDGANVVPDTAAKPAPADWVNESKVQAAMADAWKQAKNGLAEGHEEAGFAINGSPSAYAVMPHQQTNQDMKMTTVLQPNVAAEVHVHPNGSRPDPSDNDKEIANKHKIPVYTISQHGIFKYDPATKQTARLGDLKEFVK